MDFDFSDEQEQLRDAVRKWVDKGYGFERRRAISRDGGFSAQAFGELAALGLCGLYVSEDHGGKGLGSRLMESIMDVARDKGLAEIEGLVLANNDGMLKLMRNLGFSIKRFAEDPDFKLVTHSL